MADPARLDELRRRFEENPRRYFAPLASALRRGGDAAAAATLARTQLAVYPGHLTGHVILGQALLDLRDAPGARSAFAQAVEVDPGNVVALQQLLTLAREAGDAADAERWAGRLYEADPELAAELATPQAAFEPLDLATESLAERDPRLAVDPPGDPGPAVGLDEPPTDPVPEALPQALRAAPPGPTAAADTNGGLDREDGPAAPVAEPFVTATMAELLAAQGHAGQAAAVYEQLLARRPDDARLAARLAELRGAGAAVEPLGDAISGAIGDADEAAAGMWRAAFAPVPAAAAAAAAGTASIGTGAAADGDLAQFNAWLRGLDA